MPDSARNHSRQVVRKTLDGVVWGLCAQGTMALSGVATMSVVARHLSQEDYGRYNLLIATVGWFVFNVSAIFGRSTIVLLSRSTEWESAARTTLRCHLACSAAAVLIYISAGLLVPQFFELGEKWQLLLLVALELPLSCTSQAYLITLVGRGHYRKRAIAQATRWLVRGIAVIGLVLLGYGLTGAIIGCLLASVGELIVGRWFVPVSLFGKGVPLRELLSMGLPLFIAAVLSRLCESLGLYALRGYGTATAAIGVYAAAMNFAMLPALAITGISPLLLATTSKNSSDGNDHAVQSIVGVSLQFLLMLLPALALGLVGGPIMTLWFFGARYIDSAPIFGILVIASFAKLCSATCGSLLVGVGGHAETLKNAAAQFIVMTIALIILIPFAGLSGAALATLLGTGVSFASTLTHLRRRVTVHVGRALWICPAIAIAILLVDLFIPTTLLAFLVLAGLSTAAALLTYRATGLLPLTKRIDFQLGGKSLKTAIDHDRVEF